MVGLVGRPSSRASRGGWLCAALVCAHTPRCWGRRREHIAVYNHHPLIWCGRRPGTHTPTTPLVRFASFSSVCAWTATTTITTIQVVQQQSFVGRWSPICCWAFVMLYLPSSSSGYMFQSAASRIATRMVTIIVYWGWVVVYSNSTIRGALIEECGRNEKRLKLSFRIFVVEHKFVYKFTKPNIVRRYITYTIHSTVLVQP